MQQCLNVLHSPWAGGNDATPTAHSMFFRPLSLMPNSSDGNATSIEAHMKGFVYLELIFPRISLQLQPTDLEAVKVAWILVDEKYNVN